MAKLHPILAKPACCLNPSALSILQQYWGYGQFRPLQEEIIQSVLEGKDTLALLPTGGGKSICYQVPAMMQEGLCLVVSPLIALMKDQVEALNARGIRALAVFSGMSRREIDIALDNAAYGGYKFLYVSPERLETEIFLQRLRKMNINLLAVDEAHCISEWGYDFRPAYLKIAAIREVLPQVPVLALTASATARVQQDITDKLAFKRDSERFVKSFDRPNLVYAVLEEEDKRSRLLKLVQKVPGTGLVYVRTRKTAKEVAAFLQDNDISANYYHAGLEAEERSARQEAWKTGRTRIMACTNAFGMGIDKAEVRLVVHYDLPESLEAYYQEAGRGGRDEKRAFAIALTNEHDKRELTKWAETSYPTLAEVQQVYHALGVYYQIPQGGGLGQSFDFSITEFCQKYELNPLKVHSALKVLEQTEHIALSDSVFMPSRLMVTANHEDLYAFEVANRKYEPVLKLILRSYGGCFEEYVHINEQQIGQRLSIGSWEAIRQLKELHRLHLLDYQPMKNSPQLTYLTERLPKENLDILPGYLAQRKKVHQQKLDAIFSYAFAHDRCRGKIILNYFGEDTDKNCGHCDWCLKKSDAQEEGDMETLQKKAMQILEAGPLAFEKLVDSLDAADNKKAAQAIRWMIDEGLIQWQEGQLLAKA